MAHEQKIIFFDIDGTLLSTAGAGHRAIADTLRDEFDVNFPLNGVLTAGRTDRGITDEIFGRFGVKNSAPARNRFRTSYLSRLSEYLVIDTGHLLPEVQPLLQKLAEINHITLSLITGNYEEGAWIKLRHFGLDSYFTFGGFGDHDADRNNVARNAMATASAKMGFDVTGQQAIVVGDTAADIRCARAIGAKAVAVATGTYSRDELELHGPDLLFDDFSDVSSVAQILLSVS